MCAATAVYKMYRVAFVFVLTRFSLSGCVPSRTTRTPSDTQLQVPYTSTCCVLKPNTNTNNGHYCRPSWCGRRRVYMLGTNAAQVQEGCVQHLLPLHLQAHCCHAKRRDHP